MEMSERPTPGRSRAWLLVALLALGPLIAALILDASNTGFLVAVLASGLILVAAGWAWAIQRARRLRDGFADRLASWTAERAVAQERLRIARDLHDLSSHGLGLITVRAAAAGYLEGPDADAERRQAMIDIERIGRSTTDELRRMLTLLRTPADDPAPLHPADTLAALPGIVHDAERGGLIIQQTHTNLGDEHDGYGGIAPSVQLAVCVIVREALTNVLRYAGPTTVRLAIGRVGDTLQVSVDDDGKLPGWQAESGAGYGLTGLRERVEAHGGTLTTSPTGHGFRLDASIPMGTNP